MMTPERLALVRRRLLKAMRWANDSKLPLELREAAKRVIESAKLCLDDDVQLSSPVTSCDEESVSLSTPLVATFSNRTQKPAEPGANDFVKLSPAAIDLIGFILLNDYVCPPHDKWMEMWHMIPEDAQGHKAGGPVPLDAWHIWHYRDRHAYLIRHIECADARGVINKIDHYLRHAVKPDEWITGFLTT